MKKCLSVIVVAILIITLALPVFVQAEEENIKVRVVENKGVEEVAKENEPTKKVQNVTVRILEGEYENEEYEMAYVIAEDIEGIISNLELKEDDNILVSLEEKDGEVTNITYLETVNQNYILYIIGTILIILLLIVSRKRAIIIYLLAITLVSFILIFSMQKGWNLILVSSIVSLAITIAVFASANGAKSETITMILKGILGIAISGILMYVLFDIMGLNNINVKIAESFMNIKDLICSGAILFACGIYNAILIAAQYIFYSNNRPYKTKSDNIIEGQRSLKL